MSDASIQLYTAPFGLSATPFLASHHPWERADQQANGRWEAAMEHNECNTYGCPLQNQSGADGIKNFELIVAQLSADERAAFEAERAARHAEREHHASSYTRRS